MPKEITCNKAFVDLMLSFDDVISDEVLCESVVDAVNLFRNGSLSKLQLFSFLDLVCNKLYEDLPVE